MIAEPRLLGGGDNNERFADQAARLQVKCSRYNI